MTSLWAAEVQSFTRRALTGAPHTGHRRAALGTRVLQCGQLFADNIVRAPWTAVHVRSRPASNYRDREIRLPRAAREATSHRAAPGLRGPFSGHLPQEKPKQNREHAHSISKVARNSRKSMDCSR